MDFEKMSEECPWKAEYKYCFVKDLRCKEENCAPFHWVKELANNLWASAIVTIHAE